MANEFKVKNGIKFPDGSVQTTAATGGGGGGGVTTSDTAPTSPTENALWWDSTVGQLRIYYNDGDTSQWVDTNPPTTGGSSGSTGPGAYVVGNPVISMQSQALTGATVPITVSAFTLLNGVEIASFEITTPAGTQNIAATNGSASTSFTVSGSTGSQFTASATAIDTLGNTSKVSTAIVTISTAFVNKATITAPIDLATNVQNGLVITTSAFAATGATDTFTGMDVEIWTSPIGTSGASAIWSATTTAALSTTVPDGTIPQGATAYIRARHVGATLGAGQWSDTVQITMASTLTPATIGTAWQGGFYAGRITLNGSVYGLVVSPASTQTDLGAHTSGTASLTVQAKSMIDGLGNTNELVQVSADYAAAKYCHDLTTAGYTDWYLPSLLELELLYRVFKPTETLNTLTAAATDVPSQVAAWQGGIWAYQTFSTPANSSGYQNNSGVATLPTMTSVTNFQGAANLQGFSTTTYWSSSSPGGATNSRENMSYFQFSDGTAFGSGSTSGSTLYTTTIRRVRAVRRVLLGAA